MKLKIHNKADQSDPLNQFWGFSIEVFGHRYRYIFKRWWA